MTWTARPRWKQTAFHGTRRAQALTAQTVLRVTPALSVATLSSVGSARRAHNLAERKQTDRERSEGKRQQRLGEEQLVGPAQGCAASMGFGESFEGESNDCGPSDARVAGLTTCRPVPG